MCEGTRTPRSFFPAFSCRRLRMTGTLIAAIAMLFTLCSPIAFAQTQAAERFVVVLDAAHGGADSGARLDGGPEKAYTLAFSVRLRSLLMARGIDVVTTRDSDATIDPPQRATVANRARAQACLSLHASESGSGVHLFVSSVSPAQPNTMLPWKTAQSAWIERSTALAGVINSALAQAGITVTLGRVGLPAIDSMTCPAVAIEIAPGHSPDSSGAVSLDSNDYQSRVADALAAALVEWRSQDRGGRQP